jgi:general secretion pathway protein A
LQNNPYIHFFSFFGLRENPFTVSPDPRYLLKTRKIEEAWDALTYGIQSREGILVLTGEAGTGKTTLINRLLDWLHERRMPTAFIFNSHLEPKHLFDFMLADFGVQPDPHWQGNALMSLSQWLPHRCREGQIPVLIVDEAQGLPLHVLEEIRLLLNLENSHEKLLQIVLSGQPELEQKLKRPEMRHLKQRIAVRCRTGALTLKETHDFIQMRLNTAGASGKSIFSPDAMNAVHDYSRGIPRVMNLLCEHALINAYAGNMHVVPARLVDEIAWEFQLDRGTHVPLVQREAMEHPARTYESLVVLDASLVRVKATAPSVTGPSETVGTLAISSLADPISKLTALQQSTLPLTHHIRNPLQSKFSSVPVRSSIVGATSNIAPIKTSEVDAPPGRQMTTMAPTTPQTIVMSPIIRSHLIKKSLDLREWLHHAWTRFLVKRRLLHELATIVASGVELGAHCSWVAFSGKARSLQLMWRDARAAWPAAKGYLVHWLRQPLGRSYLLTTHNPNAWQINLWAKLAHSLNWPRSWQMSREQFRPVALAASRLKVNTPVRCWLRQSFRPSQSRRLTSRATAQRNRIPSAP